MAFRLRFCGSMLNTDLLTNLFIFVLHVQVINTVG